MTARVVVVGAGIVGSCVALRLAAEGADVIVVEAYRPGYGATANSFAWVGASHPGLHEPEPYFLLNALGVQAYRRLEAEFDLTPWFARTGCLTWSTDPAEQEATVKNVAYLAGRGYNAALLSRDRATQLEPAAALPELVQAVAFFPDEGWVHGPPFAGRVLSHARAAGATIVTGERAVGFEVTGGKVTGLRLASGGILAADAAVVTGGRDSAELLAAASYELPLVSAETQPSDAVGLLVISRPMASPAGHVLIADDVMIRPDGGGRLIIHDYRIDALVAADTPLTPIPEPAAALLRDTARHVRGADEVDVEAVRIGVRVLPGDEMPVVGLIPGHDNLYVCATHSGVTLAPLLAELATGEILHGEDSPLLATFRPDRFRR
ncbi:MAG TPA: FAD-binding oxidoreductase [Streptosporangiaceae bacterium]|nr:FAD-binding oxidoreductase [Streptosporangiaceae bacterium]